MELRNDIELLRDILDDVDGAWDWNGPLPGALDRLLVFAESIPKDRLNPWHTVTLDGTGWHLAHPITCELSSCQFDAEARDWREAPAAHGIYRWDEPDNRLIHIADSERASDG